MGQYVRAENLARALTYPAEAIGLLAVVVARAGDQERARRLVADVERMTGPFPARDRELCALAEAAGLLGDAERAESLVRELARSTFPPTGFMDRLVIAMARSGAPDRAERLAELARFESIRIRLLGVLAGEAARAGDGAHAARLLDDAEEYVAPFLVPSKYAREEEPLILARLARDAAAAGDRVRAFRLLRRAEHSAAAALDGDSGREVFPTRRVEMAAEAVATERSDRLFHAAEDFARRVTDRHVRQRVLGYVAVRLAEAGHPDRVEALAGDLDGMWPVEALCALATRAASSGDRCRAERLRHAALGHTQALSVPDRRFALLDLVDDLADAAGEADRRTARRLLAEALPLADWCLSLPVMTKAAPRGGGRRCG
ncbi:hypothetical protein G3I77_18525 [Streptomyces sp. D2-8]|uniref:hypothetical protein n=1 Tax=Streptomyces sp. D2-8 TaxID=2707767 RepID=UPI0020BF7CD5|nr:hypothetical protein [Streptomyces sp. D2-8]MCK8434948.1 hypothetical protein [Streptomyces sp. D2-8]